MCLGVTIWKNEWMSPLCLPESNAVQITLHSSPASKTWDTDNKDPEVTSLAFVDGQAEPEVHRGGDTLTGWV